MEKQKYFTTSRITQISILAVLSFLLMQISFPLPIFPDFLRIDISDLPAVIGTLALGPLAGVLIELVKNLLNLVLFSTTAGVGELANFIVGISFMIPMGLVYKRIKGVKGYTIGAVLGIIVMVVVACISNYVFLLPAYAVIYGAPIQTYVDMANAIFSFIDTEVKLILFSIAPFNLLKGIIISVVGYLVFIPLKPMLNKI